jgi:SAM-dependent methyltransferase
MNYITKHCLFCREKERLVDLYPQTFRLEDLTPEVFSARRTTEHFHYAVVRCQNCGLVFSREILPDEVLAHLYSESKVTFAEYTDIIRKDYWRCLEPFIDGAPSQRALEIGCSSGFFLEELLSHGFSEVHGCEPSFEAREIADPRIKPNISAGFFREGLYENGSFDLLCSFQTLDHVSDPLGVMRVAHDIVKPGGLVYFITHNVEGFQAKLLGAKSPIIDIEHIYLFSKRTLRRLLEQSGFEVLGVIDVKNSYPVNYWLKMFPMPNGLKSVLGGLLKPIGLGSLPLPLKAGNIAIVARRP